MSIGAIGGIVGLAVLVRLVVDPLGQLNALIRATRDVKDELRVTACVCLVHINLILALAVSRVATVQHLHMIGLRGHLADHTNDLRFAICVILGMSEVLFHLHTEFVDSLIENLLLLVRVRLVVVDQQRLDEGLIKILYQLRAWDAFYGFAISSDGNGCGFFLLLVFAKVGMQHLLVMRGIWVAMLMLTSLLVFLSEETFLHGCHSGPQEDRSETHEGQRGCHNDRAVLHCLVDTQDKTEGHCTTDDASIGDEDQVAEFNARLIAKELAQLDDTNSPNESSSNANDQHGNEQLPGPV